MMPEILIGLAAPLNNYLQMTTITHPVAYWLSQLAYKSRTDWARACPVFKISISEKSQKINENECKKAAPELEFRSVPLPSSALFFFANHKFFCPLLSKDQAGFYWFQPLDRFCDRIEEQCILFGCHIHVLTSCAYTIALEICETCRVLSLGAFLCQLL